MENRRGAEENVSNPKAEDFPFDIMEVGDSFELQFATEKGVCRARDLCVKYSVNGKMFVFTIKDCFIRIDRTT